MKSIIVFLLTVTCAYAWPGGAPVCAMTPSHGRNTRKSNEKAHIISFPAGQTCYNYGEVIEILLSGDRNINGFSFLVEDAFGSSFPNGGPAQDHQQWRTSSCIGATHTRRNSKSSVRMQWQAPTSGTDTAKFKATTFTKTGNGVQQGDYFTSDVVTLPLCEGGASAGANGNSESCADKKDAWETWCPNPNNSERCTRYKHNCEKSCCTSSPSRHTTPQPNDGCTGRDEYADWCSRNTDQCIRRLVKEQYCVLTCCRFFKRN